jgi:copper/silver efflux system protein
MMRQPIAFSARHSIPVLAITAVLALAGAWSLATLPQDALPDWSDRQVIVLTSWERAPELVQSQVTNPLSLILQSIKGVKSVRGSSEYGASKIYLTLADNISLSEARSQIQQAVDQLRPHLPQSAVPQLGPDANATGWVYQYAVIDSTHRCSLAEMRDLQDWTIRPELNKVPGLAEVASVGGFQSQFQVIVDPLKLADLSIPFNSVVMAIREANGEASARTLDFGGQNFMVRSPGLLASAADLQKVVLAAPLVSMESRMEHLTNRPVLLGNIAHIQVGPDARQGVTDLNGQGEAVGGIVVLREGENAAAVLHAVKSKLKSIATKLPAGIAIVPVYDRSRFIQKAVDGFGTDLLLTAFVVGAVILLFLWDLSSVLVAIGTIPVCLCLSGLLLRLLHVELNVLSLTGLALSVGVLVDGVIIQVENVFHCLRMPGTETRTPERIVVRALAEVSPSVFLALSIIIVAFLPLLALSGSEGRIFRPLVLAKTSVMIAAAFCAVVITPAARVACLRIWPGIRMSRPDLFSGWLGPAYERLLNILLVRPWTVVIAALLLLELTVPSLLQLGSEFLPPLEEGSRLFMPTTSSGISIAAAKSLIEHQDRALRGVPEVQTVFAKAGHSDTATDPAPLEMVETNIELRPESEWRVRKRWYTDIVPAWLADQFLRPFWPDRITPEELQSDLDSAVRMPGVVSAWTSPIRGRTDMLSSGSRTAFVVKITGPSATELDSLSRQIRTVLQSIPQTRFAYAEPLQTGYFLDVDFDRDKLAEHGLPLARAQDQVFPGIGGVSATTIYEGLIPRTVYIRYPRDYRDSIDAIKQLAIQGPNEDTVRIGTIASLVPHTGPMTIRSEGGVPAGYVYLDVAGNDVQQYLAKAQAMVAKAIHLPPNYTIQWAGRFEDIQRLHARLVWIVPVTLLLIAAILWAGTASLFYTVLICLAVPFSLTGSIWTMSLLHYKLSAAAWVGLLALLGLDAETGIFMVLFLDIAWRKRLQHGFAGHADLRAAVVDGAARRLRPKLMTVLAAFAGMLPVLFSQAPGADFTRRLVVPIAGGLISSFLLELLIYPAIFLLWQRRRVPGNRLILESRLTPRSPDLAVP